MTRSLLTACLTLALSPVFGQAGALDASFNGMDQGAGIDEGVVGSVEEISVGADHITMVGEFVSYDQLNRNRVARVNMDGTLDMAFDPGNGPNSSVFAHAVQPDGKTIIVGNFTSYNGVPCGYIARINVDGSLDATFVSGMEGLQPAVLAVALQTDGKILIAASQSFHYGGVLVRRLARLNSDGGLDTSFDAGTGPNGEIRAMAVLPDNRIIIAGSFTSYDGVPKGRIARVQADGSLDGTFTGVGANTPGTYAINNIHLLGDGDMVIGGRFPFYNGTPCNNVVRINSNGSLEATFQTSWPHDDRVTGLAVRADGKIIIGTVAFSPPSAQLIRMNIDGSPDASFIVTSIPDASINSIVPLSDGSVLIAGGFTSFSGRPRRGIARLNADGSLEASFGPISGCNGRVEQLLVQDDGAVLLAGGFTAYNGEMIKGIARAQSTGVEDGTFAHNNSSGSVSCITRQADGKIIVAGGFTEVHGVLRNCIARLLPDGSLDATFDPGLGPNNIVLSCAVQPDGKILAGGYFTTWQGGVRNRIARLNADGSLDTTFDPGLGSNDLVDDILIQPDGRILIAGFFTSYMGNARNRLARLNSDGTLDPTFVPGSGASDFVHCLAQQADGKILIAGGFDSYQGATRGRIARVNMDGSLDTSFDTGVGADGYIRAINLQPDGKVLLAGNFTSINGVARIRVARLNANGSMDMSFDPGAGANDVVHCISIQSDGRILIGGDFRSYDGTGRNRIARVMGCAIGAACDDGNPCTSNDAYDIDCHCVGDPVPDTDSDGTCDLADACPEDPLKNLSGECGCGVSDVDTDGDDIADCNDGCPNDAQKSTPGSCGCGALDTDTDGDGMSDCVDGCPTDAQKTIPGSCGCGSPDTDSDSDGTIDCNDGCPADPLKTAPGACGCGVVDADSDNDGIYDCQDCSLAADVPDRYYQDTDYDGIDGDVENAIFVSAMAGNDANTGTMQAPVQSLAAAIALASAQGKDVYVAAGTYINTSSSIEMANGVSLYGQFSGPPDWSRTGTNTTTIIGGTTAVLFQGLSISTTIEGFVIQASNATLAGASSYAIRVANCTGPVNIKCGRVTAGNGAPGASGVNGMNGATNSTGHTGATPTCPVPGDNSAILELYPAPNECPSARGYNGGGSGSSSSPNGYDGITGPAGSGGQGGAGSQGPAPAGNGGDAVTIGIAHYGYAGSGGQWMPPCPTCNVLFSPISGSVGGLGATGKGGSGGGGGGSVVVDGELKARGGSGGFGGEGGCRAPLAGGGGGGGGGSFGIYVFHSTHVTLDSITVQTGQGGNGGTGGNGGIGGAGSPGGAGGASSTCGAFTSGHGGHGGHGQAGGNSGPGGGGVGGPSIGLLVKNGHVSAHSLNYLLGSSGDGGGGGSAGSIMGGIGQQGPTAHQSIASGTIDADVTPVVPMLIWYLDADSDGFGNINVDSLYCDQPSGFVSDAGDCDDADATINPARSEICNDIDDDCDGLVDEFLPAGLVLYLPMDAALNDHSGLAHHGAGTYHSSTDRFGNPSKAHRLDVTPLSNCENLAFSFVTVADHPDLRPTSYTIAAWAKKEEITTLNGSPCFSSGIVLSKARTTGSSSYRLFPGPTVNSWHHVVETYDALTTTRRRYVDGMLEDESTSAVSPTYNAGTPLRIGCDYGYNNLGLMDNIDPLKGAVDEVMIFNRALTAAEIQLIMGNNGVLQPPPVEVCNNLDDDCDGVVDDGIGPIWYQDADGDAFGNASVSQQSCNQPSGYVSDNTDCNDTNGSVNPGIASDPCGGLDQDCDTWAGETPVTQYPGQWKWIGPPVSSLYGQSNGPFGGSGIAQDAQGNLYTVGSMRAGYGMNIGCQGLNTSLGDDLYLTKTAADGTHQWSVNFGSGNNDSNDGGPTQVYFLNGEIIVPVNLQSSGAFAHVNGVNVGAFGSGVSLLRISTNGAYLGNLAAIGGISSNLVLSGSTFYWGSGAQVKKFTPGSSVVTIGTFTPTHVLGINNIGVGPAGDLFVSGVFGATITYGGVALSPPGVSDPRFMYRIAPNGTVTWARALYPTFGSAQMSLRADAQGNLYAGLRAGIVGGVFQWNYQNLSTQNGAVLLKVRPNGDLAWYRYFGAPGSGQMAVLHQLHLTADSKLMVLGFKPETNPFGNTGFANREQFLLKVDTAGNKVWMETFGVGGAAMGFVTPDDENYYLHGCGSPGAGYGCISSSGNASSVFIARFVDEQTEVCNSVDDDCDGWVDAADASYHIFYDDADGDGFGGSTALPGDGYGTPPPGRSANCADCDDASQSIHPGAPELCNGVDDNCNGIVDATPLAGAKLYLPFTGNANDASGNAHHGTVFNATLAAGHTGAAGAAYQFNGSNARVEVADHPDLRPANFTLSTWVNYSAVPGDVRSIVNKPLCGGWADSYGIWFQNGQIYFGWANGPSSMEYYARPAPAVNQWHHLALAFDDAANQARLYIDNVLSGTFNSSMTILYDATPFAVGADYENCALAFHINSRVDEVMLFNRALSATEVGILYANGITEFVAQPEICNGVDDDCDGDIDESCSLPVSVKVFLEGPYNTATGLMNDGMRSLGLVPTTEPYTALGYPHVGGGGESTTAPVLAVTGNDAIVDWVVLEVRSSSMPATVLASKCALLQRDGDVVAMDGTSPVQFALSAGSYQVAVRHRNHLGCMTSNAIALSSSVTSVDFTGLATSTYGTSARKTSDGAVSVQVLWAGDVNFDRQIKYVGSDNDRDPVLVRIGGTVPTATVNGYFSEDVNMTGQVKYVGSDNDRDPILVNIGGTVPTATRNEQLP